MKRNPLRIAFRALLPILIACSSLGVAAEESSVAPLTLTDVLHRALANNFDVHIQRYSVDNAEELLAISEADFDPALRFSARRAQSVQAAATSSLDGAPGPSSTTFDTRAGANVLLPTGTVVDFSTQLARSGSNSTFSLLNPAYSADATLSVTQPLLKGFGSKVTLAGVQRSRIGIDRANHDYRARVLDVLRDTEIAYYRLVYGREQRLVRQLGLKAAQELHDENRAKREAGVVTDLDVLNAEVGVANQQIFLMLAEQTMRDNEDALRALIGQFALDAPLGEAAFSDPPALDLDSTDTFERAKQMQPEYLAELALIEQLRVDVAVARNATRPQVDLSGAIGVNADEASYGTAIDRLPDADSHLWQVNLSVTYPWGAKADKARHRTAKNNLDREMMRLRQIEQNILVQARAAVRNVETGIETVRASRLATELSIKQYELEKARFDAGLSTSRRVLDAQRDLDQARLTDLDNQVALHEAIATLNRLEGRTLEAHGIELVSASANP
ncbi:MAG TPA: TolC family protein [Opitutaceae bacterium]|nr:TolC family protein [Opitutaceae bacterium]